MANLRQPYWNIRYGGRCVLSSNKLVHSTTEYKEAIRKLFPYGVYWDTQFDDPESDLSKWIEEQAEELYRFKNRLPFLIQEATPKTADTTIGDWERVLLGSVYPHLSLQMRRSLLLTKRRGFITRSVLQGIADLYGVKISVLYPFTAACFGYAACGHSRLGDYRVFSVLSVSVIGGENLAVPKAFENALEEALLANQIVFFTYTFPAGKHFHSLEELKDAVKVAITVSYPFAPARFGTAVFAQHRIGSLHSTQVALITIPGYHPTNRRRDIEAAIQHIVPPFTVCYFLYNKELIYGYVS